MLIIFMFSNENSVTSQNKSDRVTSTIIETVNKDVNKDKEKEIIENTRFVVRKIAHFTLYFVLGGLIYLTLKSYNVNKKIILISILCDFLYAVSDEIHQVFTIGRTGRIYDVVIDTISSTFSIMLCKKVNRI